VTDPAADAPSADQARPQQARGGRTVADVPVELVPYDPSWPEQFENHRRELEQVLAPWLTDGVHHIGSTSIPGCPAKPLLDMMAGVRELNPHAAEPLAALGYVQGTHRPDEALRFSKPGAALHLTVAGSDLWRERLAFRDALRGNSDLRDRYATLKEQLAAHDLRTYTDLKRPFVAEVLASTGITLLRR
jgi:GrpB-like predicted nucleotidyltransferase (UPF0157 family)